MVDPVFLAGDKNACERSPLEAWLKEYQYDPITCEPMTLKDIKPAVALKNEIEQFLQQHPTLAKKITIPETLLTSFLDALQKNKITLVVELLMKHFILCVQPFESLDNKNILQFACSKKKADFIRAVVDVLKMRCKKPRFLLQLILEKSDQNFSALHYALNEGQLLLVLLPLIDGKLLSTLKIDFPISKYAAMALGEKLKFYLIHGIKNNNNELVELALILSNSIFGKVAEKIAGAAYECLTMMLNADNVQGFKLLIDYKFDINGSNDRGETLLMLSLNHDPVFWRLLLQHGAQLVPTDCKKYTFLHHALRHPQAEIIFNVIAEQYPEKIPVSSAWQNPCDWQYPQNFLSLLLAALVQKNIKLAKMYLLMLNATQLFNETNSQISESGFKLLCVIFDSGLALGLMKEIENILYHLVQLATAKLNASWGPAFIQQLLMTGINKLSLQDDKDMTILHWAIYRGHFMVAQYLLAENICDFNPSFSFLTSANNIGDTPLHLACFQSAVSLTKQLLGLMPKGRDAINSRNAKGMTALHVAVSNGHAILAALLIAYGANPTITNQNGVTPLDLAAITGNGLLIQILAPAFKKSNIDPAGFTAALTKAACAGHLFVVHLLLQHQFMLSKPKNLSPLENIMYDVTFDLVKLLNLYLPNFSEKKPQKLPSLLINKSLLRIELLTQEIRSLVEKNINTQGVDKLFNNLILNLVQYTEQGLSPDILISAVFQAYLNLIKPKEIFSPSYLLYLQLRELRNQVGERFLNPQQVLLLDRAYSEVFKKVLANNSVPSSAAVYLPDKKMDMILPIHLKNTLRKQALASVNQITAVYILMLLSTYDKKSPIETTNRINVVLKDYEIYLARAKISSEKIQDNKDAMLTIVSDKALADLRPYVDITFRKGFLMTGDIFAEYQKALLAALSKSTQSRIGLLGKTSALAKDNEIRWCLIALYDLYPNKTKFVGWMADNCLKENYPQKMIHALLLLQGDDIGISATEKTRMKKCLGEVLTACKQKFSDQQFKKLDDSFSSDKVYRAIRDNVAEVDNEASCLTF